MRRIKRSPFYTRLTYWEHWPASVLYVPVYFYFVWLAIKSRSLLFFTASNPGIDTGGVYGESKMSVLQKTPKQFIPKTILIKPGTTRYAIEEKLKEADITFPLIAKPDIGERGFLVEKLDDMNALIAHLSQYPVDFLLQEYLDCEHEFNVLYYRYPGEEKGRITSITVKKYMTITGDGTSTVQQLMEQNVHFNLQVERFKKEKPTLLREVPPKGVTVRVEPIGNHARGTTFYDGRKMVDEQMLATFNNIAKQIPDIFIFRFDAKCKTPDGLKTGECLKFVEVNGAGGEPTHIYETGYSLIRAWGDLMSQWRTIYEVSRINNKNGIPYMSFKEGVAKLKAYNKYKEKLSK